MTIEFTPAGFDAFQNNITNVQTVGIGTTNPTQKLQVYDGSLNVYRPTGEVQVQVESGDTSVAVYRAISPYRNWRFGIQGGTNADFVIRDITSSANRLGITSAGEVIIGSNATPLVPTGTTSQPLQVTGGAYVSDSVGIGTTRPTSALTIGSVGIASDGKSQIYLNGTTSNRIDFNTNGSGAPAAVGTSGTTRSAGTKIVLYPGGSGASSDYGFGIESNALWSSIPSSSTAFKWYAGTVGIATLSGTGALTVTGGVGVGATITAAGDVDGRRFGSNTATVTYTGTPANFATIVATGMVGLVTFTTTGIGATINVTGMIAGQVLDVFVSNPTTAKVLTIQYSGTAIAGSGIATASPAQGASFTLNTTRAYRFIAVTDGVPVAGDIRVIATA